MVLFSSCDGVPLKIQKEKRMGVQFTSTNNLNLVLTPLRIRRTIPLRKSAIHFLRVPDILCSTALNSCSSSLS
jgi:hypothetical protein